MTLNTCLLRLWSDDAGAVLTTELILIVTLLVIGLVTGLACFQQAVASELKDVAGAVGHLNQSYYTSGFSAWKRSCQLKSRSFGSSYLDRTDLDFGTIRADGAQAEAGVDLYVPQQEERIEIVPGPIQEGPAIEVVPETQGTPVPCPPATTAPAPTPGPSLPGVPCEPLPEVTCPPATGAAGPSILHAPSAVHAPANPVIVPHHNPIPGGAVYPAPAPSPVAPLQYRSTPPGWSPEIYRGRSGSGRKSSGTSGCGGCKS